MEAGSKKSTRSEAEYEYIIVGSGAGGGPLAANLARRGYKVLLLEAGGDLCASSEKGKLLYEVPIFHGLCTEEPFCSWNYFVHHYRDPAREQKDSKYDPNGQGIWYPRAGTLGGCTAHNAMITVTPQAMDWDYIAHLTGDWSWRAENMYKYFARLENCGYVSRPGTIGYLIKGLLWSLISFIRRSPDRSDWTHGHGFDGWLSTGEADPKLVLTDRLLLNILFNTIRLTFKLRIGSFFNRAFRWFDPNDALNSEDSPEGLALTPLATWRGKRNGPREYVLRAAKETKNLEIKLETLAKRILFEKGDDVRAVGVEALEGPNLYEAAAIRPAVAQTGQERKFFASREIIICAGAFNSPQLLKLSGIGPRSELENRKIKVIVDLPGVGENLQDRYEVAVVSRLPKPFVLLRGATFELPEVLKVLEREALFKSWKQGKGLYCSNGSLIGIMKRSSKELPEPDLYIFGLPGTFRGYYPGYSEQFERFQDRFTWVILKAYTNNSGRVTLKSDDPTKAPHVQFKYFDEGPDEEDRDLRAVMKGVEFVRDMNAKLGMDVSKEIVPGSNITSTQELSDFIKNEAWGHHASCTNKIGAKSDPMAVLDSRFRVRGTKNLRVVDASVFPKIPGYFIVSAVYMIAEKASDVIAEDANRQGVPPPGLPLPLSTTLQQQ